MVYDWMVYVYMFIYDQIIILYIYIFFPQSLGALGSWSPRSPRSRNHTQYPHYTYKWLFRWQDVNNYIYIYVFVIIYICMYIYIFMCVYIYTSVYISSYNIYIYTNRYAWMNIPRLPAILLGESQDHRTNSWRRNDKSKLRRRRWNEKRSWTRNCRPRR